MAGQQFQYDDSGNTFLYFLTSFVGLIVIPATYYLWPRDQNSEQSRLKSIRQVYRSCLWYQLRSIKPQQNIVPTIKKAVLLLGWAIFIFLAYKVSKTDKEYQEYNPYEVLGLDPGATVSEIKKQYRLLSLKFHPDKGGDEVLFMRIAKAYAALTDEQSRKNWEEYGNPDGPQATNFGIALPAWIVDQKNSMLVLFVYGLAFMVILPVVVGSWWYKSIRYSGDQILIRTTQIYTYFVYKTRNMDMKRLIMVLAGASEFDPQYNKDATSRPADNVLIPQLIRELGGINLKKNEPPLTCPYSLKARVLLLAHLSRMQIPETLKEDQQFILKKCPALLQEMVNVICQLIIMARSREERELRPPSLASLENCMKLCQMTVQGLQQFKSPFLQLPFIEEDHLRRVFNHKKFKIKTIRDLVSMKESDRRLLFSFLEDSNYEELVAVLGSFPHITMEIKPHVLDDEDSNNITVGSLVTVLVTLRRQTMAEVFEKEQSTCSAEDQPVEEGADTGKVKNKGWQQKNKTAKKASKSKKKKPVKKKPPPPILSQQKPSKQKQGNDATGNDVAAKEEEDDLSEKASDSEDEDTNKDSQSDGSDKESDRENDEKQGKDDEAEWQELQQSIQRKDRALLETKSKITHPVYSLYFPEEKQEWWWIYIADRKDQTLISMPYHICTLKDQEEVELKFPAPSKPGNYQYTMFLRSDSYMGLDQIKPLKLEVHEAKPIPENHPQWDTTIEGDDDQGDSEGFEESYEEEEEDEEED
ncbi:PREDICTED: translocation protein SEC63 homolog [Nanorana parkeri]|uniref:translocation protein SEC63 homolog n=1 Tax=Nanorana parkeri TaxID=125878 RepID=UPI000854CC8D|nr:PREDICTED: translocation protein SEC63 homolog [Nanorana parkeri]